MDPVPDTVSDAAERVARVIRRLVIVCVVLAIVLGGLRWVSGVTGLGLFEFMQPSASDVLDGRTANAQRLAAIRTVDEWMDHDAVPGATVAGRQVYTYCDWGQNNPEVRDGYRLRCEATGALFSSWAGSFDDFARAVASGLDRACSAESTERPGPPDPALGSIPQTYHCSGGLSVTVTFEDTDGADVRRWPLAPGPCTDDFRCISGASGEELRASLTGSKWYVVEQINAQFYEDLP